MEDLMNKCPNCGEDMDFYDCHSCGYCSLDLDCNEYETPEGNITACTEEQAYERGYIFDCECGNQIQWWEKEDHGKCVSCWDKDNRPLTN